MSSSFLAAVSMRASDAEVTLEDPAVTLFWTEYYRTHVSSIIGHTHFRVCFDNNCNAGEMMRETRVALMLRGAYCEAKRVDTSLDGVNHVEYEAVLPSPAVLNEVRVRAVRPNPLSDFGVRSVPAFTVWGATPRDHTSRLDSPWLKEECVGSDGLTYFAYGVPWWLLVEQPETKGFDLEVRCFALCNVPRIPSCSASLREVLLAMPTWASTWAIARASGCTPLTVTLARLLLEGRSKLRAFLTAPAKERLKGVVAQGVVAQEMSAQGEADGTPEGATAVYGDSAIELSGPLPADEWFRRTTGVCACTTSPQLRAWPSKGSVQQLVVLWMCAPLIAQHEYTEPELYAHISDQCAYQPDHAVVRKEMVRHGYLEPPIIRENADHTTSTTYKLGLEALEESLRGEILSALVHVPLPKSKAKAANKGKGYITHATREYGTVL
eukprot:CAMPEP_0174738544 /NCGR_PEP_ID=MMETSP1094-20130205/70138_1 /TAXON_ID=156173 /ORGANISM="Chrysochromulina brevifilum, Strain UTEX LB 985" /LENGTH=437 /DNA_ID=CAMNT_0015941979 /DNA_START=102 /DNA_END=1415 /DNA_ORIENTATION=+